MDMATTIIIGWDAMNLGREECTKIVEKIATDDYFEEEYDEIVNPFLEAVKNVRSMDDYDEAYRLAFIDWIHENYMVEIEVIDNTFIGLDIGSSASLEDITEGFRKFETKASCIKLIKEELGEPEAMAILS